MLVHPAYHTNAPVKAYPRIRLFTQVPCHASNPTDLPYNHMIILQIDRVTLLIFFFPFLTAESTGWTSYAVSSNPSPLCDEKSGSS